MNPPDWFWSTLLGAGGMAVLFGMMFAGTRKKGRAGQMLSVIGFVIGGIMIYVALNDDLLRQVVDFIS